MIHNSSVIVIKSNDFSKAKIGPFCFIGPNVQLEDNVELISNVLLKEILKLAKEQKFSHLQALELSHKI